ncbi:TlpA family protein disulfide reductase [Mucilaginibacter rubeus]|uniref:TlpA family protein disulfide reductase n=1 Tax=Mucilaginibacter rubeus TaxID=2027860 RepID=UPI001AA19F7C|nr:TlpA disulfide reductase family protein [Mucilaginibacter rubeus]QTE61031.1 TlpA family protein disulfide reductase [Mucilaginibacter rubeus]
MLYAQRKAKTNTSGSVVIISGRYYNYESKIDSVNIDLWDNLFTADKSQFIPHRSYRVPLKNGRFTFKLDSVYKLSYFSLSDFNDKWGNAFPYLKFYLIGPGDNINIAITNVKPSIAEYIETDKGDSTCVNCKTILFAGKGSEKNNCRYSLDTASANAWKFYNKEETAQYYKTLKIYQDQGAELPIPTLSQESNRLQKRIDYILKTPFNILYNFKSKLSNETYGIVEANLIGKVMNDLYAKPMSIRTSMATSGLEKDNYKNLYKEKYQIKSSGIIQNNASNSVFYLDYILTRSKLETLLLGNNNEEKKRQVNLPLVEKVYNYLKFNYTGQLKEKLLTAFVYNNISYINDDSPILSDCLYTVKNDQYLDILNLSISNNQIGKTAYNFSLPDRNDRMINLSDYKGKVVFIDFWFTGCQGCIEYFKNVLSKVEEAYSSNENVVFISISLDANKDIWNKGVTSNFYTSTKIINLYKANSSQVIKQYSIVAYPHPLLIDKEGKIFSNSENDLRAKGVNGLTQKIKEALELKSK